MKVCLKKALIVLAFICCLIAALAEIKHICYLNDTWLKIYEVFSVITEIIAIIYLLYDSIHLRRVSKVTCLMLVIVFYEFSISLLNGMIYPKQMLIDICLWPLLISMFFQYSIKYEIPEIIKKISLIGLILCCYVSQDNISLHLAGLGRSGAVIFPVYYCFAFLTFILIFYEDKLIRYFSILIVVIAILMSSKRTGILIVVGGVLVYFLCITLIENKLSEKIKKYILYVVIIVFIFSIGYYLIEKFDLNILERLRNISSDGGSDRDKIWRDVINAFKNSKIVNKILGHGFHAVKYEVLPFGKSRMAHNTYLETLYDYGIVGLCLLLKLELILLSNTVKLIKSKNKFGPVMAYSMVAMILMTMTSYLFEQGLIVIPFAIFWGISLGESNRLQRENIDHNPNFFSYKLRK